MNKRIKNVGELAKITESVVLEEIKGGLEVTKRVPKNLLIKTHTARRTGCTNMYLARVPLIDTIGIFIC